MTTEQNNFITNFYTKPTELYNTINSNNTIFYPIQELLFFTIVSVLLGAKNWNSIVNCGEIVLPILRNYFPFILFDPNNMSTACLINKLFNLIDNKHFNYWLYNTTITLLKNLRSNKEINKETAALEVASDNNNYNLTIRSTNCQQLCNITNYLNFSNTVINTNIKDVEFFTKLNNKIINYNGTLDNSDNGLDNGNFFKEKHYYIKVQLITQKEFNQDYAANNMLKLHNIVVDIIKQYKIKVGTKRSINMIYKLLNNNNLALIDFLNKWIYGK